MTDCCGLLTYFREALRRLLSSEDARDTIHSAKEITINGRVVLRKKTILHLKDRAAEFSDALNELDGNMVTFQLVSAHVHSSGDFDGIGAVSEEVQIQNWNAILQDTLLLAELSFLVGEGFGRPGAILVTNNHRFEFFLESVTLDISDDHTQVHFPCNSWVYNSREYSGPRIFFSNEVYLPIQTPVGVKALRERELKQLRGNGSGERKESERIYDYSLYNDLGNPDKGKEYARPILGGSQDYPYPRRCYTGRKHTRTDYFVETPTSLTELIYVPRDEIFDPTKTSDFVASSIKAVTHILLPSLKSIFLGKTQFRSFEEVNHLYVKGLSLLEMSNVSKEDEQRNSKHCLKLLFELSSDTDTIERGLLKFPPPQVIQASKDAWSTDDEFARQTIGGMHPMAIERLQVFPPVSKLDPAIYGPSVSSITVDHVETYLEGMSVQEALDQKRLYILDYHDIFLPYIERINSMEDRKAYATRSIFFLTKVGTLRPVAIELSLQSINGQVDRVFVPPRGHASKEEEWLWRLAKTHTILNDTALHQLGSHFLRSHAVMEPFIIASYRQLSAIHPLFVLLLPHFKNTMNINALARKVLLNANTGQPLDGGFIERTFTAGKYSMEISSKLYQSWHFDEQALPADLMRRGMAERDAKVKHGLRLLIEDYPYAVDGLEVWDAISSWVFEYVMIYYKNDADVKNDSELQGWWTEIQEKGHGDKKNDYGWPSMASVENLVSILTTIIWLASAHHAAINFGQYPYAGYMPYRPTMGRKLIPLPNADEYASFFTNPEDFLLSSVSSPIQTTLGLAIIELLSAHASNEEYLGQRMPNWTNNLEVLQAFKKFQEKLVLVEQNINERNKNPMLKNRYGDVQVAYTLLFPSSTAGITNRGIPNSISI